LRCVQPDEQAGERRLAGAGSTNDRDVLARLNVQRHIPKRKRTGLSVAEADALQSDLAAKPVSLPRRRSILLRRRVEHIVQSFDVASQQLKLARRRDERGQGAEE